MTLEDGITALPDDDVHWELGGLSLDDLPFRVLGVEGLEGVETDTVDTDWMGDGSKPGLQRLAPRAVTLTLAVGAPGSDTAPADLTAALKSLNLVVNPLPDRYGTLRMLRWRLVGDYARRLYYRPANGQAVAVAGDEARIKYDDAAVVVRIECPDGIIVSDEFTDYAFTAGQTRTIVNDGSLTAKLPTGWSLTAATTVTLSHGDYPESITFPATGSLSVSRTMEIITPDTYGLCSGPGATPFPRPPLLRPGNNPITASAACTLRVWSTG